MSTNIRSGRPRIYLIQPKFPPSYWGLEHFMAMTPFGAVFPPLGLLTLAGLTPKDFPITLCDENAGETVDFNVDADIICITGYLLQERNVFEMADRFRALGKLVVLGGPMANLIPQDCRPHCDVLFEGEAEYTWPRFLDDYCAGNHADRYYEEEKIHLPDSPPPRVDILKKKYAHGIVQCSRGCPFTCEFCDIIVMYGRKMRYKTIERVIQEIEAWKATGTYQVFFADDNFVGNRAYAKELLRGVAEWNNKQRHPMSFYTQTSVDMARDEELLGLLRDANFNSVFLGIESPRKSSLAETKKMQNERIDLVEAIHKIQSYNLFISAGMIVGFDNDDASIFDEQFEFLQAAQIPIVMSNVLIAVPKTPLYKRLKAEGRLLDDKQGEVYNGTSGGTNFRPLKMTQEELLRGQKDLFRRLYHPDAFAERLLGNLSRFSNVTFKPERFAWHNFGIMFKLIAHYWWQGSGARKFFWNALWKTFRHSPRLIGQMSIFLGMYMHFSKVHAEELQWNPWTSKDVYVPSANGHRKDGVVRISEATKVAPAKVKPEPKRIAV